uniref:Antitoxin component of toxin-antitoxin stability system, DNA-binding transcriptional repressor n=1 Tax=Candidatus Kentrum sp. LPFa TaxID=2126335 RepID=A0A450W5W1_9GAMM|nr:MAG: Antitoxin component of toxin-antitoxin stability system, DNA-binding transcriptional repressor [Candidatus Kentron sp. LPFa]
MTELIVNVHETKMDLSLLLEKARVGREIIFAEAGKPCARLTPLARPRSERQPGRLGGRVDDAFFDPLGDDELNAWEGQ